MANNRFNKQVSPKGYEVGGKVVGHAKKRVSSAGQRQIDLAKKKKKK